MIVPLLILDLCVSFYQAVCFPIYKIVKIRRADYIVFDRQHLATSTGSRNSTVATVLMEPDWLPIYAKSSRAPNNTSVRSSTRGTHARYARFLDYGDAPDYEAKLEELRIALGKMQ